MRFEGVLFRIGPAYERARACIAWSERGDANTKEKKGSRWKLRFFQIIIES